jgi:hypothetical protein
VRSVFRSLPLAIAFATTTAFADIPSSPEIVGKVVDAASGYAIPEAIVVASVGGYGGSMFGHGHDRQLHCTAVRADALGRFRIPAWTWSGGRSMSLNGFGVNLIAYHPHYTFYAPGGLASVHQPIRKIPLIGTTLKPAEVTIPMQRFGGGDSREWGFKIGLPLDWFRCDWDADVSNTNLVWEAMLEEVEAFDAEHPGAPMKSKLEHVTKRPPSWRPKPTRPPPVDIPLLSPTDPGRSAPAR